MVDFTKSKGMDPIVRQNRGPGMNLGLKKPRYGFKKGQPRDARKSGTKSETRSNQLLNDLLKGSAERAGMGGSIPTFTGSALTGPTSMLRQS